MRLKNAGEINLRCAMLDTERANMFTNAPDVLIMLGGLPNEDALLCQSELQRPVAQRRLLQ